MRRTREAYWRSIIERREGLFLKLIKEKAAYAERKRAMLEQEKELLREAPTPAIRRHLQQLTAKDLLTEAYAASVPWKEFGPLVRRCQRVGFADITHEIHVACLFVQSVPSFPKKAREAFAMLEEAERKLRHTSKSHYLRREGMQAITHARSLAEAAGFALSEPVSRARATAKKTSRGKLKGTSRPRASRSASRPPPTA